MKNNNPYSKYRYDNSLDVKFRSNDRKVNDIFGTNLKLINSDLISKQLDDDMIAKTPWGITWTVAGIYKATRTTTVDNSIIPTSYKGPTFFKLFKL